MSLYDLLAQPEKDFHDALVGIANKYGPIDENHSGIWVGYKTAEQNDKSAIGVMCGNCSMYKGDGGCMLLSYLVEPGGLCRLAAIPDSLVHEDTTELGKSVGVGSMVTWGSSGGNAKGKIKRVIRNGKYKVPNSDFEITGTPDSPAAVVEVYHDGKPSGQMVGHKLDSLSSASTSKSQDGISKADDTYAPNDSMKAAARRALKWKEDGKAHGAGTPVGWGRASDIVAGRSMSLDTVKRMYSFFSRHEVDKKGKDFHNNSNPSHGRIMWEAWGGDAGFAWSRSIVEREKSKKVWEGSAFSL
jgi:hypothetical protein